MYFAPLALSVIVPATAPQDAQLELVDRVEVIVNDEILTYRQVMETAARNIPDGASLTAEELRVLRERVGLALIDERLQVQGGIDMGFADEAVRRKVSDNTDRKIGSAGGVIQMADELGDKGISLFEEESKYRRNVYRWNWTRAITGLDRGVSGRVYRDRYVRPGQLKLRYGLLEEGQPGAETIQGTPARYHLQELLFPIPPGQTESETTRLRAEEVRKSLLEGLDFTTAVKGSSIPAENDGILRPMTGEELIRNGGPETAAFAISAKVGQISGAIPILRGRSILGWRLVKLLDSDAPLLPIFESPKTQALLRLAIQKENDNFLRSEGLERLNQGAYIWFSGSVED